MKTTLIAGITISLSLAFPFQSVAGEKADSVKAKYANVSVVWESWLKVNIYTTFDGQTTIITPKYSALDSEKGETAIFSVVNMELERLSELGYRLTSTTTVGQTNCIIYTLVKG